MGLWIVDIVFFFYWNFCLKKVFNFDWYIYKFIWNVFFFFLIWEVINIKIYWCVFFNLGIVNICSIVVYV